MFSLHCAICWGQVCFLSCHHMSDALEIRAYATSLDYHSAQWASFVLSIGWTGTPEGNLGIVVVDLCRLDALSQSVNQSASAV